MAVNDINRRVDKLVTDKYLKLDLHGQYIAMYVWIDGTMQALRCKPRSCDFKPTKPEQLPVWNFDGSSTYQAEGSNSDVFIKPQKIYRDPFQGGDNVLVLCDTYTFDYKPHPTNKRYWANEIFEKCKDQHCWFGLEQEYTLLDIDGQPYGWPKHGFPAPQGPYYCGVGIDAAYARDLCDSHLRVSLHCGLTVSGTNGEVMPSQWEFQVGPCEGIDAGDQLWMSRFLLHRVAEDYGIVVTLDPKPIKGDWNGAGCHHNFSTEAMRKEGGIKEIEACIEKMSRRVMDHICAYDPTGGEDNKRRLTGKHETARYDEFTSGVANRGTSIRIPRATAEAGKGYLEDRRPASNVDPYAACGIIAETACLFQ